MATIYKSLSAKENGNGMHEILLRLRNGKDYDVRGKSGIFITADNFKKGEVVVNRRKVGNDVAYHEEQEQKLNDLCTVILNMIAETPKANITPQWLNTVIDKFNNPEKYVPKEEKEESKPTKDIYTLMLEWTKKKGVCIGRARGNHSLMRTIARYVGFVRATDKKRKDFVFDVDRVTRDDIEDFFDYVKNEKSLSEEYPTIFAKIVKLCPEGVSKGRSVIMERGGNHLAGIEKRLRAFFNWLYKTEKTTNKPFEKLELQSENYGDPYYLSINERNEVADYDLSACKRLETQRDIFVFHCFVGCRIGDLMKLTEKNVVDGVLIYVPHKTKNKKEYETTARVPLHEKAVALIEKYKGVDANGRLFPFISPQKYNDAIKEVLTEVGITRNVVVRNSKTGENEVRPINEIASSHMARRTFVGATYFKVSDPSIIGKMSGHAEGSRAFARYRNIEDSTLKAVINMIG